MQAFNFITMTEYGGKNAGLAGNGELPAFATFNQLKSQGYSVNKGAKAVAIFCGYKKSVDTKTGKETSKPVSARVFDIIDTSASSDKQFIEWLKSEIKAKKLKRSSVAVDQIITSI